MLSPFFGRFASNSISLFPFPLSFPTGFSVLLTNRRASHSDLQLPHITSLGGLGRKWNGCKGRVSGGGRGGEIELNTLTFHPIRYLCRKNFTSEAEQTGWKYPRLRILRWSSGMEGGRARRRRGRRRKGWMLSSPSSFSVSSFLADLCSALSISFNLQNHQRHISRTKPFVGEKKASNSTEEGRVQAGVPTLSNSPSLKSTPQVKELRPPSLS